LQRLPVLGKGETMVGWIVLGACVVVLLWIVSIYNGLVKRRNRLREAWSGIDVQLKRRSNLIPNLVETVKGYATHEKELLAQLTAMRGQAAAGGTAAERAVSEGMLSQLLGRLLAVAEAYPDLKASSNFSELQSELSAIEEQIQSARRYYNGTAREMNILVESFPSNLVAQMFRFEVAEFFEIEIATERDLPDVKFA